MNIQTKIFALIAATLLCASPTFAGPSDTSPDSSRASQPYTRGGKVQCQGLLEFPSPNNGPVKNGYAYGFGSSREGAIEDLRTSHGGKLVKIVSCSE